MRSPLLTHPDGPWEVRAERRSCWCVRAERGSCWCACNSSAHAPLRASRVSCAFGAARWQQAASLGAVGIRQQQLVANLACNISGV